MHAILLGWYVWSLRQVRDCYPGCRSGDIAAHLVMASQRPDALCSRDRRADMLEDPWPRRQSSAGS
jgi:hypothetical protein